MLKNQFNCFCFFEPRGITVYSFNLYLGLEGKVTIQKRSDMPYFCAFLEEVFRFRTLGPLGVQHAASEDAQLDNYSIPKGTLVSCFIACKLVPN